ncbi:MAG: hypothetical protein HY646_02135 [Acidobacteria bacterium]|nr:hypothetical protein [Acidobacteriota bacterium]
MFNSYQFTVEISGGFENRDQARKALEALLNQEPRTPSATEYCEELEDALIND